MNLIADLRARNMIQDIMPGTEEQLLKEVTAGYVGFDPTGDSLHVGHLMPVTLLMRLQRAGHKPIAVVGGATGMIGDPSGKSAERNLLSQADIEHNCAGIKKQLEKLIDFDQSKPNAAELVNNYDWLKDYSFLEFIRDIGKHITISYMLSKDSVQNRLETGLSFTEFTYQLIQGYDFYWLNANKNVKLQMGGADQWGNMLTGSELVRRKGDGSDVFALTGPLITKSDGSKFGKTESGAVWLDPERTSPYQFYQFWLKMTDADAEKMTYTFSFRTVEEIAAQIAQHREAPEQRLLQKALAEEMTLLVHSQADLDFAREASQILYSANPLEGLKSLSEKQLMEVMDGLPKAQGTLESLSGEGLNLIGFLAENNVFPSKGEAKKMIQAGGISINKEKVTALDFAITPDHLWNGRFMLIQKGKKYTLGVFS